MAVSPTIVIVGAGPAALAAVGRLRLEPSVRVVMVAPGGTSDFLAGTLPVATGDAPVDRFRAAVTLDGVEVVPAAVDSITDRGVMVGGSQIQAQAVIAAPGLAFGDVGTNGAGTADVSGPRILPFWDLDGAANAAPVIGSFERGVITVVISSPVYRCPPAPYGLALRLASRIEELGLPVQIRLTTPEQRPLAAIGTQVSDFLRRSCEQAGIKVAYETLPDPGALASGELVTGDGTAIETDLALVIPPHRAHPLLAELAGPGPLVVADGYGRTDEPGLYVAGDAVASPFPRAVAPAALSGIAAAEGALVDLGFDVTAGPTLPEPDCFVDRGAGDYSRIQISYPDGPPPGGSPAAMIGEPETAESGGFDDARTRWYESCGGSVHQ